MAERIDRGSFLRKIFMVDVAKNPVPPHRVPFTFFRPPGAPLEPGFLSLCTRCSLCEEACPEKLIIKAEAPLMGVGTPIVDPSLGVCTECGECIEACPEGALSKDEDERMGLAVWHPESCLSLQTISCVRCVEACPKGEAAIQALPGSGIVIHPDDCTGCAACYHVCPTDPKSLHLQGRPPVPLRGHPPVPGNHG